MNQQSVLALRVAITIVAFFALVATQANAQESAPSATPPVTYEKWIQQYEKATSGAIPFARSNDPNLSPRLLAIFEVGDEQSRNGDSDEFQRSSYRFASRGYSVLQNGRFASVHYSVHGAADVLGGFPALSEPAMAKVRELAANLPDDHAYLPPVGRRLVVQATNAGATRARVYDRANIPDIVLDTIAAVGANDLLPWIFQIKPDHAGPISEYPGVTAVHQTFSPNGSVAVVMGNSGFTVVDPGSGQLIHEVNESFVGRLLDPRFSPDGEYLVIRTTIPSLLIYETGSWRRVTHAPELPQDATSFWPNSAWNSAVIANSEGSVELCNGTQPIAQIAEKSEIVGAEFSPDDSLVAIATRPRKQESGPHEIAVTVWHADGTKLSSFRFGTFVQPTSEGKMLVWLSDGQHLLSPVQTDSKASLAVWNVQTGRYDTELTGCDGSIKRFVLEADQVKADCDGRGVYQWDMNSALKKMTAFEATLK